MRETTAKNIVKAGVLLIASLMILSSVAVTADTYETPELSLAVSDTESVATVGPTSFDEVYLGYDMDTNVNAIGLTSGGSMEAAIRLTAADELPIYEGYEITAIKFHHGYAAGGSEPPHTATLKIYETTNPANPGTPVTTETYTYPDVGWYEVAITSPVVIQAGYDYWIGISMTHLAGEYPFGAGPGPHVPGKGDWVNLGGWQSLYDATGGSLDYNWNIQAKLEGEPPLMVSIDGPYTAYVGEDIDFSATVSGGTPPYTYDWDFGDSSGTSTEEEPTYAYDDPGVYTVELTVTDDAAATKTVNTTATILELPPHFNITLAGMIGVTATITNDGDSAAVNPEYTLDVTGGILGRIDVEVEDNDTELAVDASAELASGIFIGLGSIEIKVTADADNAAKVTVEATAFVLGPFVLGITVE